MEGGKRRQKQLGPFTCARTHTHTHTHTPQPSFFSPQLPPHHTLLHLQTLLLPQKPQRLLQRGRHGRGPWDGLLAWPGGGMAPGEPMSPESGGLENPTLAAAAAAAAAALRWRLDQANGGERRQRLRFEGCHPSPAAAAAAAAATGSGDRGALG
eukprot:1136789-Pelagomonas_calceolata.AAC.5